MTSTFPPTDQLSRLLHEYVDDDGASPYDLVVPTGFRDLDESLHGGLRADQLVLVAGAPGVGTSIFALDLARNAAIRQNLKTVVVAPDTSEREILLRILAAETKVPVHHVRRRHLEDADHQKVDAHRDVLSRAPILVNAGWQVQGTTGTILDSVQVQLSHGVRFVVVDGTSGAEPHTRELVKGLKLLAQTYRAFVVVVSKVLLAEARRGDRPTLEDLRDYAEIADLIDVALILHRADLHDWDSTRPGEADLEIAKHRYGPTRRTTLLFQGFYARFVDVRS